MKHLIWPLHSRATAYGLCIAESPQGINMRRNPHNTFRGSSKKGPKHFRYAHGRGSIGEHDKSVRERL
jgi:hypothetical protein